MTTIEHRELKGITIKNLLVTIVSTASIVASVMTSYLQLKNDIHDIKISQETQYRIYDIRLKVLETNVTVLQHRVDEMNKDHSTQSLIH
jgi:ABC-type uncharacterized transport system permease subunit